MDAISIKAGPYYINVGGEVVSIDSGDMSVTRKDGTGHLSRGGRGFIDLCIFRTPGLTVGPLKRKVIWTHRDDIKRDAIEAGVKCVAEQVAYLTGLPEGRRPSIIVYHVDAELTGGSVSEAFVAVDEGFTDEVFDNLYNSPGYPEYKQPEFEDYIPEFLRKAPSGEAAGSETGPVGVSGDEGAGRAAGAELRDTEPRYEFVGPLMEPTWHPVMRVEKDYRKEGGQYLETDVHKLYGDVVKLTGDLAKACGQGTFPEFSFFLEALASLLRTKDEGMELALDLERRAPYFRYGRFQERNDEVAPPTLSEIFQCFDRLRDHKLHSGDYSDSFLRERCGEIEASIEEAIQERSNNRISVVADRLYWECLECLIEGMGPESLCLARAVLFLSKARWEAGDRSRLNDVASAHGEMAWALELKGEWRKALEHHRLALEGYRACKAGGGWFYDEDIADEAYCVAYLTRSQLEADALLRECIDIYQRLPVDAHSAQGLVRTYTLLAKAISSGYDDLEERDLRKKAADLRALNPELFADGGTDAHLDECLTRYERAHGWAE